MAGLKLAVVKADWPASPSEVEIGNLQILQVPEVLEGSRILA